MDTLRGFCLKRIAKDPVACLTEDVINQAKSRKLNFLEAADACIFTVTDAGKMSDSIPVGLFEDKRRSKLSIRNSKLTDTRIRRIIDVNEKIEDLDVAGVLSVQDDTIRYALEKCKALKALDVTNCRKLTDRAFQHIEESPTNLIVLRVGGNFNMSSAGLWSLLGNSKKASRLEELRFSGMDVTSTLLSRFSSHCRGICSLGISYSNLDDAMLASIITLLAPSLEALCISWNEKLTSNDLLDSLAMLPRLQQLDVNGLKSVTFPLLQDFLNKRIMQV